MTRRLAYLALALGAGALTADIVIRARFGAALALAIFCAVAPDLTMLNGFRSHSQRGQLSPRAVPFYNAVHRVWGPLALIAVYLVAVHEPALLAGALAWLTHIAVDRTVGFGLRDQAGFQRRGNTVLDASRFGVVPQAGGRNRGPEAAELPPDRLFGRPHSSRRP
jgi:hypothetical protein